MAVDRVIVSTKASEDIINKTEMNKMPNPNNNPILVGGLRKNISGIGITYLPRLDGGTLFLDFNLPKLMSGDNIHSIWCFNIQTLWEKLCSAVMPIVSLASPDKDYPNPSHLRYWKVNYFEFNFDLIDFAKNINQYFNAISKIEVPRLDRFADYDVLGTVYNLSNGTPKDSNIVERIYLKLPERVANGYVESMRDYEERKDLLNLLPGQDVLRFEVAHARPKIRYNFKYGKDTPQYKEQPMGMFQYSSTPAFPGCFGELVSMVYQQYCFERIVNKYHLDKTITSRQNLYKVINSSNLFSFCTASTAKKIVKFLNGETSSIKYSDSTINQYKNLILKTGYHYITADFELTPITYERIRKSLTDEQKLDIARYSRSDLIRDNMMQYYSIHK